MKTQAQPTVKQRRVKVADSYFASGYGRGINQRNVYKIDGKYYAYHPEYARQSFRPLEGEFTGYIPVNVIKNGDALSYHVVEAIGEHHTIEPTASPSMYTKGEWRAEEHKIFSNVAGNTLVACLVDPYNIISKEEQVANTQRIVKAVSLLSFIEKQIEINNIMQWTSEKDMAIFGEAIKAILLKQSQGK